MKRNGLTVAVREVGEVGGDGESHDADAVLVLMRAWSKPTRLGKRLDPTRHGDSRSPPSTSDSASLDRGRRLARGAARSRSGEPERGAGWWRSDIPAPDVRSIPSVRRSGRSGDRDALRERGVTVARPRRDGDRLSRPMRVPATWPEARVADITACRCARSRLHTKDCGIDEARDRAEGQDSESRPSWTGQATEGYRADNPCQALKAALPRAGHQTRASTGIALRDRVSGALSSRVRASACLPHYQSSPSNSWSSRRRARVRSGARSGDELDLDAARCGRFRASGRRPSRPHRVPLSTRALEVLSRGGGASRPHRTGVPERSRADDDVRHDDFEVDQGTGH